MQLHSRKTSLTWWPGGFCQRGRWKTRLRSRGSLLTVLQLSRLCERGSWTMQLHSRRTYLTMAEQTLPGQCDCVRRSGKGFFSTLSIRFQYVFNRFSVLPRYVFYFGLKTLWTFFLRFLYVFSTIPARLLLWRDFYVFRFQKKCFIFFSRSFISKNYTWFVVFFF